MIKINFHPLHIHQEIAILAVMTFDTGKFILTLTMVDCDITMSEKGSVPGLRCFLGMTNTAAVTAYGILAGKDPECYPW